MAISLALALISSQDRPTVKETLSNGSTVFVHKIPGSKNVSMTLAFTGTVHETPETHGARHLLEHVIARSNGVDKTLESMGAVLIAETTRDAVTFQVSTPASQYPIVLPAILSLIKGDTLTAEAIAREVEIMRQEWALRSWRVQLVGDSWLKVFGPTALDPFGDTQGLVKMTPDSLTSVLSNLTDTKGLCVSVAGDLSVDSDRVAAQLKEVLGAFPARGSGTAPIELSAKVAGAFVGSSEGESVALAVDGLTDRVSLATLAAGFALRSWIQGCEIYYVPSQRQGLVTVTLDDSNGWAHSAARLRGKEALVAQTGLQLVRAWVQETSGSPSALSKLMATSLPLRPGFNLDTLSAAATSLKRSDVQEKIAQFLKVGQGE